ncbi:MAG: DMT family transporter [Pseudomonadota bacterium]
MSLKALLLTSLAIMAFAANSVFCRLALQDKSMSAASFTGVRLLSGALVLWLLVAWRAQSLKREPKKSFKSYSFSAFWLFLYAITFSVAYVRLDTATGALLLFGVVQLTLVGIALVQRQPLHRLEWLGIIVAFGGLVYLMLPGIARPPLLSAITMGLAGFAWGVYTFLGKSSQAPLSDTHQNFLYALPWILVVLIVDGEWRLGSSEAITFAVLSGGLASGVGYSIWYHALAYLSASQAASFQLLVPVIAAIGGMVVVGDSVTLRLFIASFIILLGISVVILGRKRLTVK